MQGCPLAPAESVAVLVQWELPGGGVEHLGLVANACLSPGVPGRIDEAEPDGAVGPAPPGPRGTALWRTRTIRAALSGP